MTNSNSFNVCSRCGSANSLSAKYCYQCGSQLKVPEEPVVCPKCHSINSSLANFCRTCGSTLKSNAQTKICPRCKKEVSMAQAQCSCGYAFATVRQAADFGEIKEAKQKGGRLVAVLSLVFALIFALALTIPFKFMQVFASESNLHIYADPQPFNIVDMVAEFVFLVVNMAEGFLPCPWSIFILLSIVMVTATTMAVHIICAIVRIFHGRRGKRVNAYYAIMFVITGLVSLMFVLANTSWGTHLPAFLQSVLNFFKIQFGGAHIGWGVLIVPAYFLFFFIFSFFAKRKKTKKA